MNLRDLIFPVFCLVFPHEPAVGDTSVLTGTAGGHLQMVAQQRSATPVAHNQERKKRRIKGSNAAADTTVAFSKHLNRKYITQINRQELKMEP